MKSVNICTFMYLMKVLHYITQNLQFKDIYKKFFVITSSVVENNERYCSQNSPKRCFLTHPSAKQCINVASNNDHNNRNKKNTFLP